MKTSIFRILFMWIMVVLTLVMAFVWIFMIWQSFSYKNEVTKIREEMGTNESREKYLTSIKNVLRDIEVKVKSLENMFIAEASVPDFIDYLENKADSFGIKANIGGISLDPVSTNGFKTLHVRVNGSGRWSDAVSFVHSLDTMPYVSEINRVSFTKIVDTEGGAGWGVVVDISQTVK
jgi:Tfp pilus assembly protein PilO